MNVLIMLNDLRKGNGMASVMMAYYDGVLAEGIHVDFLVLRLTGDEREEMVRNLGSHLYVLPASPVKYSREGNAFLKRLFAQTAYDIVHVNMPGPYGAWVLGAAEKGGVRRRIYHCHNPREVYSIKARISSGIFDRLIISRATQLLACSRSAGESVFGKKPFSVLENCIDTDRFAFSEENRRAIRAQYGIADDVLVVGSVARLENQKNPLFALDCYEEIARKRKAFLLWVGDGSLRGRMEEEIERRGLGGGKTGEKAERRSPGGGKTEEKAKRRSRGDGKEEKAGTRSLSTGTALAGSGRIDVAQYYSAFDVFLLPSRYEGLGIVFLEAQANGLPVYGSLNVPEDAAATPLMKRLSLEKGPRKWAEIIISAENRRAEKIPECLRERYDIHACSRRLAEYYLRETADHREHGAK